VLATIGVNLVMGERKSGSRRVDWGQDRAGLRHIGIADKCYRAYDVEGAFERRLQNILNVVSKSISSVLYIVGNKLYSFALEHQYHVMRRGRQVTRVRVEGLRRLYSAYTPTLIRARGERWDLHREMDLGTGLDRPQKK